MSVASFLGFVSLGVFWYAELPITRATRFCACAGITPSMATRKANTPHTIHMTASSQCEDFSGSRRIPKAVLRTRAHCCNGQENYVGDAGERTRKDGHPR